MDNFVQAFQSRTRFDIWSKATALEPTVIHNSITQLGLQESTLFQWLKLHLAEKVEQINNKDKNWVIVDCISSSWPDWISLSDFETSHSMCMKSSLEIQCDQELQNEGIGNTYLLQNCTTIKNVAKNWKPQGA